MPYLRQYSGLILALLVGCSAQQSDAEHTDSFDIGTSTAPSNIDTSMRFTVVSPCQNAMCDPILVGEGTITNDTPAIYMRTVAQQPRTEILVLISPGGNLLAGIELGRKIRASGLNTVAPSGINRYYIRDAQCNSACAYAFLGGNKRSVENGAKLGFHQFSSTDNTQSNSDSQLLMAVIGQYLDDMGIDRRLSDISARTDAKDISLMSRADAVSLRVDNSWATLSDKQVVDGTCAVGEAEFIYLSNQELQSAVTIETIENKPPPPDPHCSDPSLLPGAQYACSARYTPPTLPPLSKEVIKPFPIIVADIEKEANRHLCRQQIIYLWDRVKREVLIPRITGDEYRINAELQAHDSAFERFLLGHEN